MFRKFFYIHFYTAHWELRIQHGAHSHLFFTQDPVQQSTVLTHFSPAILHCCGPLVGELVVSFVCDV